MKITLPAAAATWVAGVSTCNAWALGSSLTAPVAGDAAWLVGALDANDYCSWSVALSANKAYGVQLTGSAAAVGVHAPVDLSTWNTNVATNKGPKIDGNPVFDTVVVIADSTGEFAIEATKPTVVAPETTD